MAPLSLTAKLADATAEEKLLLRTGILQQLRTVFAEIVFKPHAIAGLIELPEKPKSTKGPFGIPKPIQTKPGEGKELRYFFGTRSFRTIRMSLPSSGEARASSARVPS
jgi:hypothetical protein